MLLRVTNKDIIHKNIVYIHCCSVSMVNFEQVLSREFKFVDFGWTSIAHKLVFYKSKWQIQCRTLREMCLYFRSFPGLYFTAFRLNTDSVSLRIQSECTKIRTRKTPNIDTFYTVNKLCQRNFLISQFFFVNIFMFGCVFQVNLWSRFCIFTPFLLV